MAEMVEVDEGTAEVGKLAQKLLRGKHRGAFQKLIVADNPEVAIPEVEAERAIEAAVKPLKEELAKRDQKDAEKEAAANLAERRKTVPHVTGDELKKLEQFMVENGISKHDVAYREMHRLDKVEAPRTAGSYGKANMPEDKDGLYKDPAGYRTTKLHSMIDNIRAGKPIE